MSDETQATPVEGQSNEQEGQAQAAQPSIWDSPSLSKFKGADGVNYDQLGESYTNLEKMVGERIKLPTADSPKEEWDKFYAKKRGVEKPGDYHIELPGIDGLEAGEIEKWKSTFYENGMTQSEVSNVMNMLLQDVVEGERKSNQEKLQRQTETQVALKQEWGANYEANVGMIKSGLRELGGEELVEALQPHLEEDKGVATYLYEVSKVLRSSAVIGKEGEHHNFGLVSADEARAEIHDIKTNEHNVLNKSYKSNRSWEERKPAMERINALNKVIAGHG